MRNTLTLGFLIVALAGCMTWAQVITGVLIPAYGVTPELAQRTGCNYDSIQARAVHYREMMRSAAYPSAGFAAIPEVGMDHCEVLAMLGVPNRQTQTETQAGRTVTWHYRTGTTMAGGRPLEYHMVQFRPGPGGRPVVSTVVW